MPFSLYDATIPSFVQVLGSVSRLLDKAEAHCADANSDPAALISAKLAEDMLPLGYQVKSVAGHSIGAIEGVRAGVFSPDRSPWPADFAGLKALVTGAHAALEAIQPDEINGLVGQDMAFVMGERRMEFTAENFLMSFSVPNFYFHAATAYDILRAQGLQIGKLDFLGRPRIKG
jgi:uncharacterized protein